MSENRVEYRVEILTPAGWFQWSPPYGPAFSSFDECVEAYRKERAELPGEEHRIRMVTRYTTPWEILVPPSP